MNGRRQCGGEIRGQPPAPADWLVRKTQAATAGWRKAEQWNGFVNLVWTPVSAQPRDDDNHDEENPGDKEDQSPAEVIPNSHATEPSLRSALNEFTAATKRDTSGAAHCGIARAMVGRDHQLAT